MTSFPWKPLRLGSADIEKRLDEAFSELIDRPWGRAPLWEPEIDLHETEDAYILEADLPGVDSGDIQLEVEANWVTLSGQRRSQTWVQSGETLRMERRHGSFSRKMHLAHAVDPQRVETRCEQGIFYARLPKKV